MPNCRLAPCTPKPPSDPLAPLLPACPRREALRKAMNLTKFRMPLDARLNGIVGGAGGGGGQAGAWLACLRAVLNTPPRCSPLQVYTGAAARLRGVLDKLINSERWVG